MKKNCDQAFYKPKKRTLQWYKFFARKQQNHESLRQFWNTLMGLAAKCDFGKQSKSLIMDAFFQNMLNKTVQERLCTEPKDQPQEALRFAIALAKGNSKQKNFVGSNEVKPEPVLAVESRTTKNPCTRCGVEFNHSTTILSKKAS